ncbi:hypothetical protein K7432_005961 [Basidiobolus ranarum]|uniref:Uncharacterized protein n=1 Tax=Basidiobolus ranarum TaxID=34480 RepID=A0ABR2W2F7_9FUNG
MSYVSDLQESFHSNVEILRTTLEDISEPDKYSTTLLDTLEKAHGSAQDLQRILLELKERKGTLINRQYELDLRRIQVNEEIDFAQRKLSLVNPIKPMETSEEDEQTEVEKIWLDTITLEEQCQEMENMRADRERDRKFSQLEMDFLLLPENCCEYYENLKSCTIRSYTELLRYWYLELIQPKNLENPSFPPSSDNIAFNVRLKIDADFSPRISDLQFSTRYNGYVVDLDIKIVEDSLYIESNPNLPTLQEQLNLATGESKLRFNITKGDGVPQLTAFITSILWVQIREQLLPRKDASS